MNRIRFIYRFILITFLLQISWHYYLDLCYCNITLTKNFVSYHANRIFSYLHIIWFYCTTFNKTFAINIWVNDSYFAMNSCIFNHTVVSYHLLMVRNNNILITCKYKSLFIAFWTTPQHNVYLLFPPPVCTLSSSLNFPFTR